MIYGFNKDYISNIKYYKEKEILIIFVGENNIPNIIYNVIESRFNLFTLDLENPEVSYIAFSSEEK